MKRSLLSLIMMAAALGGCSTLARDGPTGAAIEQGSAAVDGLGGYAMVDLDYGATERIKLATSVSPASLSAADSLTPVDVIGAGDGLAVAIFEPGGSLFSSRNTSDTGVQSGNQVLPTTVVDRNGTVSVPFAGAVRVEGLTTTEAARAIRRALSGKVNNPQVVVSISNNVANAVTVLGEVNEPGRAPLTANADRILDVIADRGGASRPTDDIEVSIRRGDQVFTAPLSTVNSTFGENIRLGRGDLINLLHKPRRFSTFGALGQISQQEMGSGATTLAAALSRVGGLDTNSANARTVFVFRFEDAAIARSLGVTQAQTARGVPIVYQLNLEQGQGFFTAANFVINPDDIVYVPRSRSAELRKFFELIQSVTRVVYDVSVTSTLNTD